MSSVGDSMGLQLWAGEGVAQSLGTISVCWLHVRVGHGAKAFLTS